MATFISLITETQEGETRIHDTVARAARFREEASELGATVKDLYWTLGELDGFVVFEAPDEETAAALVLRLGSRGSVRTRTMRAFDAAEMQAILARTR
jgi:uncharacterized protein with GYD domain